MIFHLSDIWLEGFEILLETWVVQDHHTVARVSANLQTQGPPGHRLGVQQVPDLDTW